MGFSVDCSVLVATHVLDEAAVIIVLIRWILSWALRLLVLFPSSGSSSSDSLLLQTPQSVPSSVSSTASLASPRKIRNCLSLNPFEMAQRLPEGRETCAVCLNQLRKRDQVRELDNCRHKFHRGCIDRWLDHDVHKTCPLCRASLLKVIPSSLYLTSATISQQQPSWAVERILYLFGDDLLIH